MSRTKAGSQWNLPFLFVAMLFLLSGVVSPAKETPVLALQEFESSCIDLGDYNAETKALTVRFVGRKPERFYRYSNIPISIWKKLTELNETGGVGEYFTETVVHHPEKYSFEELTIRSFRTIPRKKKAEDSK